MWQSVLGELEVTLSQANFRTWFGQTSILSNEDGRVVIGVPNVITKQWMEKKFHTDIKAALERADDSIHTIEFKVGALTGTKQPEVKKIQTVKRAEARTAAAQPTLPMTSQRASSLNPRYIFDAFVVGSSNEFAYAAAQAVAKNPGTKYNPLFVYGGVGLGKTHLMQAVGHEILRSDPSKRVEYVTIESFTNEFINAIQKKKNSAFTDKYRNVDVLMVDDMQFLAGKEKTQDEFFHTFNALHQANKQIIISSDKPPQQLVQLEDRLRSRFAMGITVDIQPPDLEMRSAIIQSKAQANGAALPLEVVNYIAKYATSNIRELEGALTKVLAQCEHSKVEPDLFHVQRFLEVEAAARPRTRPATSKVVIDQVAAYFDLTTADILGPKRDKEIVLPRQIAMYIMRHDLKLSYPKVASAVGGRDHTTAIHSVTKIEKRIDTDESLRSDIQALRERLNSFI